MAKRTKLEKASVRTPFLIILSIIIGIYCLSLVIALLWSVLSSLKSDFAFSMYPFKIQPLSEWQFINYSRAFLEAEVEISVNGGTEYVGFVNMLLYSLIYSIGVAFLSNFTRSMCAYVVARYRHLRWTNAIHVLVIVLLTVAFPGNLAVTIAFYKMMNMYNNIFLCVVVSAFSFSGPHFLYMYAAFSSLSKEYAESAEIDGANQATVMFKIMMPMVKNIFIAVFILDFIALWNDYNPSLLYLPNYPMLSYALFRFQHHTPAPDIPVRLAASTIVIMPTLLLFILFRNQIMSNLSIGGLKG
ncbi:MAG: carbohydrate ABC transporter permease [Clostridiales bacterium]|nr:carbohydrate ABC transporter permease [Clostridiales bacterium]